MNRRKFVSTAMAGAGGLSVLESIGKEKTVSFDSAARGSLKILATNWGFAGTVDAFCTAAKKEGFDGAEFWWPQGKKDQEELFVALKKHDLAVGFLCGSGLRDYNAHLDFFKKSIDAAVKSELKPLYINCHSGGIISVMRKIKPLLIAPAKHQKKAEFRFIMKHTGGECFLQRILQEIL